MDTDPSIVERRVSYRIQMQELKRLQKIFGEEVVQPYGPESKTQVGQCKRKLVEIQEDIYKLKHGL
jgi:hypothetical protein